MDEVIDSPTFRTGGHRKSGQTAPKNDYLCPKVPQNFPLPKLPQLNIPRPDHPELKTRPDYIPPYLPLLKQEEPKKEPDECSHLNSSFGDGKSRKNNTRDDWLSGDDWLSSLYDFDAKKAGLVKDVEVLEPIDLKPPTPSPPVSAVFVPVARTPSPPAPVPASMPVSVQYRDERRIIDEIIAKHPNLTSAAPTPVLKLKRLSLVGRPPKKALTVAQLSAAKAAVMRERGQLSGAESESSSAVTFLARSFGPSKCSPTKAARKAVKAILSALPPKEPVAPAVATSNVHLSPVVSEKSSQNSSFSIDECISSVIEQANNSNSLILRQTIEDTVTGTLEETATPSPKSSTADQLKRLCFIESAIAQVCLSSQKGAVPSIVDESDTMKRSSSPLLQSSAILTHGEPSVSCSEEKFCVKESEVKAKLATSCSTETKTSVIAADKTKEERANIKESKKRKTAHFLMQQTSTSVTTTKRSAPPPMPAFDSSTLFRPDVVAPVMTTAKKVAPLVLQKPKIFDADRSKRTPTPTKFAAPTSSASSSRSDTPSIPSVTQQQPVVPPPKKLGPLKIKLNLPAASSNKETTPPKLKVENPPPSESKKRRLSSMEAGKSVPWAPLIPKSKRPKLSTSTSKETSEKSASISKSRKAGSMGKSSPKLTISNNQAKESAPDVSTFPKVASLKVPKLILKLGGASKIREQMEESAECSQNARVTNSVDISMTSFSDKFNDISGSRPSLPLNGQVSTLYADQMRKLSPVRPLSASPPPPTPSPRSLSPTSSPGHLFIQPTSQNDEREEVFMDQNLQSRSDSKLSRPGSRMNFESIVPPSIVERVEWPDEDERGCETEEELEITPPLLVPKLKIKEDSISQITFEKHQVHHHHHNHPEPSNDEEKIWYCPVCQVPYEDGVDMIACDKCDNWFHWTCVGLTKAPPDHEPWFCTSCDTKRIKSQARKKLKK
uniref:PHD-type domain-containing protein n=1 Tax=Romanomermis culicivorax TaxID=13658 RepID=A0A915HGM2_ROMCU